MEKASHSNTHLPYDVNKRKEGKQEYCHSSLQKHIHAQIQWSQGGRQEHSGTQSYSSDFYFLVVKVNK